MSPPVQVYAAFPDPGHDGTGGNPAAVVLDAEALSPREMAALARELGVPTTVFVVGERLLPEPAVSVRFFTPEQEIGMCGHATVAAFTSLVDAGRFAPGTEGTLVRVITPEAEGTVTVHATDTGRPLVELELPPARFREVQIDRGEVAGILGSVTDPALPLILGGAGLRHVLAPFERIQHLAELEPDFGALRDLGRRLAFDTLCAFAAEREDDGSVRMRDFSAPIGKDEEAASGTTSAALCAYLVRVEAIAGSFELEVRQGVEMGRPSRIRVRREPDGTGGPGKLSVFGTARRIQGEA